MHILMKFSKYIKITFHRIITNIKFYLVPAYSRRLGVCLIASSDICNNYCTNTKLRFEEQ